MVVTFLNEYMTAMANVVEEEGGLVDKFIGDRVMAVFLPQGGATTTPADGAGEHTHAAGAGRTQAPAGAPPVRKWRTCSCASSKTQVR